MDSSSSRRSRSGGIGLTLLWIGAIPLSAQERDWSQIEVEATHISGPVHVLITNAGGNIGVSAGPDGVLIVDDQFAPLADKIRAAIDGLGAATGSDDLSFVLNTHYHGDHTGGNVEFGPEATIVAHANVRRRLANPAPRGGQTPDPAPDVALPVVTFGDSVSIHFNEEEIRVIHLPRGHTDGDAVIFFTGSNVVHMGDDFFAGRFPYVDLDAGGSVRGLLAGIDRVLASIPADAAIIPGHGPLSTVEDLREYRDMLEESVELMAARIEQGLDLEGVVAEGMPEKYADWGGGFISTDRWLQTLYRSLSEEGGE